MSDTKKRYQKELKSFRNKMGKNLAWFDALATRSQFDLLFLWKAYKYNSVKTTTKVKKHVGYIDKEKIYETETHYPARLKYFIKDIKKQSRFRPKLQDYRNVKIDMLLKNKD
jgi:hypothetical protein